MKVKEVQPVKLVIAYLYKERDNFRQALERSVDTWGITDYQSKEYFFDFTTYYEPEMGKPLFRVIASFQKLVDPGELAFIKTKTNTWESQLSSGEHRTVNFDPGYLDYDKLVLASAKYNYQKIYLGNGIFADPTLFYRKGRFEVPQWAFPDFKAGLYEDDFLQIRHLYKLGLKENR